MHFNADMLLLIQFSKLGALMLLVKCSKLEILDNGTTVRTRVDVINNDRLISSSGSRKIYV